MLPIGHFAIGMVGGYILIGLLPKNIFKPPLIIYLLLLSGLFAITPDFGVIIGNPSLDSDPLANIFWGHKLIDNHVIEGLTPMAIHLAFISMCLAVVVCVLVYKNKIYWWGR